MALGLSSSVARGILVPQPRIKPASPALQGGFLNTGPPGKAPRIFFEGTSTPVAAYNVLAVADKGAQTEVLVSMN